jgi:UDP-N-acetylglucosamine transferase subunit ALG13
MAEIPLIYVGTGTDKRYPFPRLISWVETWESPYRDLVDVRVQAGITPCPVLPAVVQYSVDELDALLPRASAAVIQGGPGGIMQARRVGLKPIVVPRYGSRGEAVDDHQVEFARWAHDKGMVVCVETEQALGAALDKVLADADSYRFIPEPTNTASTVARFAALVDPLFHPIDRRDSDSRRQ